MQWIERFILHFCHIKSLVIILLVIVFYEGLKYCPLFQKWGCGTISMFPKANSLLWHTVLLEIVFYTNIRTRRTFVSTTILLQMAGCTAVQVSRRHLGVEPLKKKWWGTMIFFFLFCPVVCSKVPVKRSYGNKNKCRSCLQSRV